MTHDASHYKKPEWFDSLAWQRPYPGSFSLIPEGCTITHEHISPGLWAELRAKWDRHLRERRTEEWDKPLCTRQVEQ
jgi:hypothetical protein